jgi:hypothetical protein
MSERVVRLAFGLHEADTEPRVACEAAAATLELPPVRPRTA